MEYGFNYYIVWFLLLGDVVFVIQTHALRIMDTKPTPLVWLKFLNFSGSNLPLLTMP